MIYQIDTEGKALVMFIPGVEGFEDAIDGVTSASIHVETATHCYDIELGKGLDAMPTVVTPKTSKTLARKDLRRLEDVFSKVSGIAKPDLVSQGDRRQASTRWWQPLRRIHSIVGGDPDRAAEIITLAIKRMRDDGLTLAAPASIEAVVTDMVARGATTRKTLSVW